MSCVNFVPSWPNRVCGLFSVPRLSKIQLHWMCEAHLLLILTSSHHFTINYFFAVYICVGLSWLFSHNKIEYWFQKNIALFRDYYVTLRPLHLYRNGPKRTSFLIPVFIRKFPVATNSALTFHTTMNNIHPSCMCEYWNAVISLSLHSHTHFSNHCDIFGFVFFTFLELMI